MYTVILFISILVINCKIYPIIIIMLFVSFQVGDSECRLSSIDISCQCQCHQDRRPPPCRMGHYEMLGKLCMSPTCN